MLHPTLHVFPLPPSHGIRRHRREGGIYQALAASQGAVLRKASTTSLGQVGRESCFAYGAGGAVDVAWTWGEEEDGLARTVQVHRTCSERTISRLIRKTGRTVGLPTSLSLSGVKQTNRSTATGRPQNYHQLPMNSCAGCTVQISTSSP